MILSYTLSSLHIQFSHFNMPFFKRTSHLNFIESYKFHIIFQHVDAGPIVTNSPIIKPTTS